MKSEEAYGGWHNKELVQFGRAKKELFIKMVTCLFSRGQG